MDSGGNTSSTCSDQSSGINSRRMIPSTDRKAQAKGNNLEDVLTSDRDGFQLRLIAKPCIGDVVICMTAGWNSQDL